MRLLTLSQRRICVLHSELCINKSFVRLLHAAEDNRRRNGKPTRVSSSGAAGRSAQPIKVNDELIYGKHVVNAALQAGQRHFYQMFIRNDELNSANDTEKEKFSTNTSELLELGAIARQRGIPVFRVPVRVLEILVPQRVHQGVVADCSRLSAGLIQTESQVDEFVRQFESDSESHVHLLLDRVLDPQNLGAIVRSAVFFGASRRLLISARHSSSPTPAASKASAGALELCTLNRVASPQHLLETLKHRMQDSVELVAAVSRPTSQTYGVADVAKTRQPINVADYVCKRSGAAKSKVLLVVGSEGQGIDKQIVDACDTLVTIESGSQTKDRTRLINCLNVSNAVAVLLHELTAKRL